MRDAPCFGLFLFLGFTAAAAARRDAISGALEICRQDRRIPAHREHCLERVWQGQVETVHSRMGGVISLGFLRNLDVGHGLDWPLFGRGEAQRPI
jgi:hypothetical protein